MSAALAAPPAHAAAPKAAAAARPALRLVQRSCDCGGPPGLSGQCDGCARTGLRPGAAVDGEIAPPLVQQALATPGQALDAAARAEMEARLGHDFSRVRIHDGKLADAAARAVGANAYTVGQDVVFRAGLYRPGTAAGDALLAHELTHAAQQAQAAPPARLRIGPADDGHERAARAAAAAPVAAATPARVRRQVVQREEAQGAAPAADDGFVTGKALNFFAEQANMIPGFRMLTIVLGVNPINMSKVAPTPGNILRSLVEFMPGGGIIVQALQNSGVFDKVAEWGAAQLASLAMSGNALRQAVMTFIGTIGISDLGDLSGLWERAKRILTEPVDRLIDFAKGLVSGILKFIKDAILQPLGKLAEGTRGWDLLIAVLGKNPITGETVPRNAENLIGGFLKLIGQDEVFDNMKKSGAIPRAWAWFQSAMAALTGFVSQIPDLFLAALQALTIEDVVLVAAAFQKVAAVFGGFLGRFIDWAGTAVWNLLEIVFDVISPGAFAYVKKTGAALKAILKDPMPFVGNLVQAAKLGFMNFGANIGTHLKAGLIDWLTGSLPGVYIPKAFELGEIVKFVFSVLGITWANIRAKLVKAIGEPAVKAMEVGFDIVMTLVRDGPAAAWEKIKEQLANLKDMVIGGITDFVVDMVVQKAIPKLVAMFIPGAGFISAIVSIYDSIMVFVNRIATIIQVVKGFIDSIVAIAGGEIAGAAAKVESILANLLSLAINFFAGFVGLGKVADKIMAVIGKIRAPIDKALDALVGWIVAAAKKLGRFIAQTGVPQEPGARLDAAVKASLAATRVLAGSAVTRPLLTPILAGVKIRYALTSVEPYESDGSWWVRLQLNPTRTANLGLSSVAQADLPGIKRTFGQRLFSRSELEDALGAAKTTALSRLTEWTGAGILFVLASATTDVGTQYSFDKAKAGQRDTDPNNRAKYGYSNPDKRSSVGLQILSKGLRADSPAPILPADATYHQAKARYDSWRGTKNFGFPVAVLGHKEPGASGHWNDEGHKQTRADNQAWNKDPGNYAGPEHEDESSASGGSSPRYNIPLKARGSHPSWL